MSYGGYQQYGGNPYGGESGGYGSSNPYGNEGGYSAPSNPYGGQVWSYVVSIVFSEHALTYRLTEARTISQSTSSTTAASYELFAKLELCARCACTTAATTLKPRRLPSPDRGCKVPDQ
jgi:hypothetical protein